VGWVGVVCVCESGSDLTVEVLSAYSGAVIIV